MIDLGRVFATAGNGTFALVALYATLVLWRRSAQLAREGMSATALGYRLIAAIATLGFARAVVFQPNFVRQAAGLEPFLTDAARLVAGVIFSLATVAMAALAGVAAGLDTSRQWSALALAVAAAYGAWFALPFLIA